MGEGLPSGPFAEAPGTREYSELVTEVMAYCLLPENDRLRARVGGFIRSAIAKANTRNWRWALTSTDIDLVNGQAAYDLLPNFKTPRNLSLVDADGVERQQVGFLMPKRFLELYEDLTGSGDPEAYTIHSLHDTGQLTVHPTPIGRYSQMRLRYFRRLAYPVSASEHIACPSEFEECLLWLAKADLAAHVNPQKVAYAQSRHYEMWTLAIRSDNAVLLGDTDA